MPRDAWRPIWMGTRHPAIERKKARNKMMIGREASRIVTGRGEDARALAPHRQADAARCDRRGRILVVDSDPALLLLETLESHGMRIASTPGPRHMMHHLARLRPNLVFLGLRCGRAERLALLQQIKASVDAPMVIAAGDERDGSDELECGADDYMANPIPVRELAARIRAILRRTSIEPRAARPRPEGGRCRFGDWEFDRRARRLTLGGKPVRLTRMEYNLLTVFLGAPQRLLSRAQLSGATCHGVVVGRSIDVQVARLRRKLRGAPDAPSIIRTERGAGYTFMLSVDTA
jgi:two-component system, OmpR family, response regulator